MDFRLLGPVELRDGDVRLDLGPAKQRCVLAVLLMRAGREVATDVLVGRVWGTDPPGEVRNALYSYVTRLRGLLRDCAVELSRTRCGYTLHVPPDRVDLHRFAAAVGRARDLPPPEAARELETAVAEWRGEPLHGLPGDWAESVRAELHSRHVAVLGDWASANLGLGRSGVVVDRLGAALEDYPHAESLIALLMRALHAEGRTAEALEYFEAKRLRLRAELDVSPGAPLSAVHRELLRGAERPSPVARTKKPPSPSPLPAAPSGFAGRDAEFARLDALAEEGGTALLLSGTGGAGKTALAVAWAHRIAARFPDGQLYVNLRGHAYGEPLPAITVLTTFLHALGVVPDDVPLDEDSASALYRSLLATRRTLVVLDNAADTDQLRSLLPSGPGNLAVVTSRHRLGDLVAEIGAHRIVVGPLTDDDAVALLARVLGDARVAAEPAAAATLAKRCGNFPLALRIVAAHLLEHPGLGLTPYAEELRAGNPLAVLEREDPDTTIRATFASSYRRLPPAAKRVFRLLGLHPGPDFTVEAACALADLSPGEAKRAMRALASASLVEQRTATRYAFHDLLRYYAEECLRAEESYVDRRMAAARLADHYVRTADAAVRLAAPVSPRLPLPAGPAPRTFTGPADAERWLDTELVTLVAFAETADWEGRPATTWLLSDLLRGFLHRRAHYLAWRTVTRAGVSAARRHGGHRAQAVAYLSQGALLRVGGNTPEALLSLTNALTAAKQATWPIAEAAILVQLGAVYHKLRQPQDSVDCLEHAVKLARRSHDAAIECEARNQLGDVCRELGALGDAERHLTPCLALCRELGDAFQESQVLTTLALVVLELGHADKAVEHASHGLALARRIGNPVHEAGCRINLASAHLAAGRAADATEEAGRALAIAVETKTHRMIAAATSVLATIAGWAGQRDRAARLHARAVAAGRTAGDPRTLAEAATRLAEHTREADDLAQALKINRANGFRGLEARTLLAMTGAAITAGDVPAADQCFGKAEQLLRETGYVMARSPAPALRTELAREGGRILAH
ncbi:BTAD domain-containing putative transcriptional regulator [Amycolatopsis sp. NPDC059027]|uniref:AfsR/SARP family transcriptional regulator n=1 Tax=unclassified Amycolatopsis TaxID=2618356 RepID=UPI003671BEBD